jgi:D-sedoheptulose 7-phosphate isomerase
MAVPTSLSSGFDELSSVLQRAKAIEPATLAAGAAIVAALQAGGQVFACGNGGSAADALHLAEELVGRYRGERRALPAICLNADVAALTCIGNDYGYERVFARQIEALGRPGDVLVGFTTSGNSPNVLAAFAAARERGMLTILAGGGTGGQARGRCDHELIVPSENTARIQEIHTLILHTWLEQVEAVDWSTR